MSTAEQDPRLQVDAEGLAGLWTRFTRRVREGELGSLPVIIGLIIIWIYFSVSEENFLTAGNLTNLMLQIAGLGIIATGVVMVLLLGEIDLSVGIVSGLAAAVMAVLSVKNDWPGWAAILAALLVGLGVGLFQGFFITFFRVPSFVVTLAGLLGFQGVLLYVLGDTGTINLTDSQILDLANTFYSDYVGWIIAIVLLVPYVLLTLNGYRRRLAAGLDTGPPILLAAADGGRDRGRDRRRPRLQRRPRRPAGGADLHRHRDPRGLRPAPHGLRPARLRGGRQRRGGAPGRDLALAHPPDRLRARARRSRRRAACCWPRACSR